MSTSKKYIEVFLACLVAGYAIVAYAGAPLKGVDIKLGKNPGGSPAARAITDDEGKFTFENLSEGTYDLYCSYDQCVRCYASQAKSTGSARTLSPEFQIELQPSEAVSFTRGPRQTTSLYGSMGITSTENGRIPTDDVKSIASQNAQNLRLALTSQSDPATPLATITVSGKSNGLRGHVTLMK